MPYGRKAEYYHFRQFNPKRLIKKSFRNVPLSHTKYRGKKYKVKGARALVGKLKKTGKSHPYPQSILILKTAWRRRK